jgi:hypothetical protein
MYAGGDIPLNGYPQVCADEIRDYYRTKDEAEKILSGGLPANREEQEKVLHMQQLRNRITLNEVTDIFGLVNDLLGRLVSMSCLRERDEMYLLLGFYYMASGHEDGWGETFRQLSPVKIGKTTCQADDGMVLYQICAVFDCGMPLVYQDKNGKWTRGGGATASRLMAFNAAHSGSLEKVLRLFEIDKHAANIYDLRNYVDHFKYYTNPDRSLMDLYSGYYTDCFTYSTRLRKSVATNLRNVLEKYLIDAELEFERTGNRVKLKVARALKSQKFTYKLQSMERVKPYERPRHETVELDARSGVFLAAVEEILTYHK